MFVCESLSACVCIHLADSARIKCWETLHKIVYKIKAAADELIRLEGMCVN